MRPFVLVIVLLLIFSSFSITGCIEEDDDSKDSGNDNEEYTINYNISIRNNPFFAIMINNSKVLALKKECMTLLVDNGYACNRSDSKNIELDNNILDLNYQLFHWSQQYITFNMDDFWVGDNVTFYWHRAGRDSDAREFHIYDEIGLKYFYYDYHIINNKIIDNDILSTIVINNIKLTILKEDMFSINNTIPTNIVTTHLFE